MTYTNDRFWFAYPTQAINHNHNIMKPQGVMERTVIDFGGLP
jgi:hypothetical protein